MASSFRDLRVWQEAMDLVSEVYTCTTKFPKEELYGLTSQMRRAAVSVPSNIAEGKGLNTDPEFLRALYHARGSLMELQTQVLIAERQNYCQKEVADSLMAQAEKVGRSLAGLINSLRPLSAAAHH
jgi:four helix bundle protein